VGEGTEVGEVDELTDMIVDAFLARFREAATFAEDRAIAEELAAEVRPAAEALRFATTMATTADEISLDHHESLAMVHLLGRRAAIQGLTPMGAFLLVPCLLHALGGPPLPEAYVQALQVSCQEGYVRGREEALAARLAERAVRAIPTLPLASDLAALILVGDHEASALRARGEAFAREVFGAQGAGALVDIGGLLEPERSRGAAVLEIVERLATVGIPTAVSGVDERWREVFADLDAPEGALFERFDQALASILASTGRVIQRRFPARLRRLLRRRRR